LYKPEAENWQNIVGVLGDAAARKARFRLLKIAEFHIRCRLEGDTRFSAERQKRCKRVARLLMKADRELKKDFDWLRAGLRCDVDLDDDALQVVRSEVRSPLAKIAQGLIELAEYPVERPSNRDRYNTWKKAAAVYEAVTDRRAATSKPRDEGEPIGPFVRFIQAFYLPVQIPTETVTGYTVEEFVDSRRDQQGADAT
jgi:hypothetical protein